jgi:hypothetical protein
MSGECARYLSLLTWCPFPSSLPHILRATPQIVTAITSSHLSWRFLLQLSRLVSYAQFERAFAGHPGWPTLQQTISELCTCYSAAIMFGSCKGDATESYV